MVNNNARDLHPGAWWIWALGLATAATLSLNPWVTGFVALAAIAMVRLRRGDAPWALSFRLYVYLALAVIVIRIVFRVLFANNFSSVVLINLPTIDLPEWAAGITLLGPVTSSAILAGLYDGMRLAAIILAFGAANSLANPKRLLKSLPPALYEVGTAIVVALTVFPQLGESLNRVRQAQHLRLDETRGLRRLRRIMVPVLEDALDRSLVLAAGMDVRGYGRSGGASPKHRAITGALLLTSIIAMGIGFYALLDQTTPVWLSWPFLLGSLVCALAGFIAAGRRVTRTRYRPDPWKWPESVVAASGIAVAVGVWFVYIPPVNFLEFPALTWDLLAVLSIGFVPILATRIVQPQVVIAR